MRPTNLRLYEALSRAPRPKSYQGKILLVAFFGTHVPLLTLLGFFVASTATSWDQALRVLGIALVATLVGTAATLFALHRLLAPITLTYRALRRYLTTREVSELPTMYSDEAGILMADTHHAIHKLDDVIRHLASYDALTGLPNRPHFRDRVQQACGQTRRDGVPFALVSIGIDGVEKIVASWGEATGDALLRAVAQRLESVVRETDVAARLEGAQFAILSPGSGTMETVAAQVQRVLDALHRPFLVDDRELHVSASLGVALHPADGGVDDLLGHAAAAQHAARTAGGRSYRFFSTALNTALQARVSIEQDLRGAMERGEFSLHYQPKIDLASGHITGAEALLRWEHPVRGRVSPATFIPIAEETGLIVSLGAWVIRSACAQIATWRASGLTVPRVSVNLSAKQFKAGDLVATIASALGDAGIDPSAFEVEVTESLLLDDTRHAAELLGRVRALGVSVSLDDFGTGYSSLSYLKQFPVDVVKVDQSFVRDLGSDAASSAIVGAVVTLAHGLGLGVVAEGIETAEQASELHRLGCDGAQGYRFSRPVDVDRFAELLADWTPVAH